MEVALIVVTSSKKVELKEKRKIMVTPEEDFLTQPCSSSSSDLVESPEQATNGDSEISENQNNEETSTTSAEKVNKTTKKRPRKTSRKQAKPKKAVNNILRQIDFYRSTTRHLISKAPFSR